MPPTDSTGSAAPSAPSYFCRVAPVRVEDGVRTAVVESTRHAQGAWRQDELHMATVSGLVAHEILSHEPRAELRLARLSFEILGTLYAGELTVRTRTVRPGRTIELVECLVEARGRACLVARAWRLVTADTADVAVSHDAWLTPPERCHRDHGLSQWPGGFIESLDILAADDHAPGHGRCWLDTDVVVMADEPVSDLARLIGLMDTANGVAPVVDFGPEGFAFPNVDLQIHLYRTPHGRRLGLATGGNLGADGIGLTSGVLHDQDGPFGHTEQILTVRRRTAGA